MSLWKSPPEPPKHPRDHHILLRLGESAKHGPGPAALQQHGIGLFIPRQHADRRIPIQQAKGRDLILGFEMRHPDLEHNR